MSEGIVIHGFTKEDTKGWSLDMKTLVKALFPMVYDDEFNLIIGNSNLANRIIEDFPKMDASASMKDLCSHITFLSDNPTVWQAYDYLQKTLKDENWKVGDEVLHEDEKDKSGEMLLLNVMCKCAVVSYIWDNVRSGQSNGDVESISTLTSLLVLIFHEETRARAVKHLQKFLSDPEKVEKQMDDLTALMIGRGVPFVDKIAKVSKPDSAKAAKVPEETLADSQKLMELQRLNERLMREAEEHRRDRDRERERRDRDFDRDRGRGAGGRGGPGRGARGRGGHLSLPAFTFLAPSDRCESCGGTGHLKGKCIPAASREGDNITCIRCGGKGHRVLVCPSNYTND